MKKNSSSVSVINFRVFGGIFPLKHIISVAKDAFLKYYMYVWQNIEVATLCFSVNS